MTPEQALGNLDTVCANFQGTRQQHVALQESIGVIAKLVETAKDTNNKAPTKPGAAEKRGAKASDLPSPG